MLNEVRIIGNCGGDPELRYTPTGSAVATFSVAVNRRWLNSDGEKQQETEWFNVVAWNKLAETCNQYVNKGDRVYVGGRQQTRSWEGNDGQKHYKTELIATSVIFLNDKKGSQPQNAPPLPPEDDLPF